MRFLRGVAFTSLEELVVDLEAEEPISLEVSTRR